MTPPSPDPAEQILQALDPEQRAAVLAPAGPLRILAGAGTGKTRTVTHRIAHQIHTGQCTAGQVLAVTHSKKAAAEMRERLSALGVPSVNARTFHSAALSQLRYFWRATNLPGTSPVLIDTLPGGRYGLIRTSLAAAQGMPPARIESSQVTDTDTEITWAHAQRVSPGQYATAAAKADRDPGTDLETVGKAYRQYEKAKTTAGVLDFDDLLSQCAQLIENDPGVAERIRAQYSVFSVDEYQDTDPAQQRLLDAWLGTRDNLTVVGDPQQAIYSFKGADPSLLQQFPQRWPYATSITLVRNYRSTPQVCELANRISRADSASALLGKLPDGPAPSIVDCDDEAAELRQLVATVRSHLDAGVPAREIAVLHRFNSQSPALRGALTADGLLVAAKDDDRFYELPEITQVLTALRRRRQLDEIEPAPRALEQALVEVGFDPQQPPSGQGAARERWENRAALRTMALDMINGAGRSWTVAELLAELDQRAQREHVPVGTDAITVCTIHKAKGLEWDVVLLPRMTDGALPSTFASTPAQRAEERRLFYVAVTRAKRTLRLSWPRVWGPHSYDSKPSPYLNEVNPPTTRSTTRPSRSSSNVGRSRVPLVVIGQRISHDKYGLGRVIAANGDAGAQTLSVDFGSGTVRTVKTASAPITVL